jgi:hypothetical protein
MTLDPRYDIGRTGSPAWARRDHGPMNTYVPGPLSSEPLQSSYHSGTRLVVSGVIFAAIIVFVVANGQAGFVGSAVILVALWALYVVPAWLRGRVGLRVDGPRCEVHGWFRTVGFEGADVARVQFVFAGKSPDVRLVLRNGRKLLVVASRLEKGHSTLYEWLRRYAPEAVYDPKALDLRDTLVNRGLMGAPGDPWDEAGRYGPAPEQHVGEVVATPPPEQPVGGPAPTPIPAQPVGEHTPTPLSQEPADNTDRDHEGSSISTIESPTPAGTTSDIGPSDSLKTSPPAEAKAPDSTETRTDDDEQA